MAQPSASTVRPTSFVGGLKSMLPLVLFCAVTASIVGELITGAAAGAFLFLAYRMIVVREIICRHHRKGILLTRDGHFERAIASFEKSEEFWQRHAWLDRSRALLLASAGPWPFVWLARYNQAYCLTRLGRGTEALERLDSILRRRPDMSIARELRDVLRAGPGEPEGEDDPTWGGMVEEDAKE